VKKEIQDKIDAIKKQAKASKPNSRPTRRLSGEQDSLSKAITNKVDAAIFLAELDTLIKLANEEQ
jgi:hypothetical protein